MKLKKLISFTIYICFAILLTSCIGNNLGDSNNNNKAGFKGQLASNTMTMNIDWSIDKGTDDIRQTLLADMGWHLLTAKVSKTDSSTKPTPVQGLQAVVYPKPSPQNDRGQKIELEDINCKDAIFSKVGDSCSVYFKISYDNPKITDDDVRISINVAPVNYPTIPSSGAFTTNIRSYFNYGNYRAINSFEKKYYQGSIVASNSLSYKILLMQNASLSSLNIITISPITNPAFSLMHRTSTNDNDPYYGSQNECSLTANANNKQVNQLAKLHDYCILVYKASDNSSRDYESQAIEINTNAEFFFPAFATNYYLKARYEHGDPIPSQTKNGANFMLSAGAAHPEGTGMRMDTAGALATDAVPTPYPFRLVNLDYTFSPGTVFDKAPSEPLYRDGMLNVLEDKNTNLISSGTQILTDASTTNPVTVGSINATIPEPSQLHGTEEVQACGGAYTLASTAIKSDVNLARDGWVHVAVGIISTARCANRDMALYENNLPFNTNETITVYNVNERGCGGGNWDIGGVVTIRTNGCNGNNCSITTNLMAEHNGVGDQCRDRQSKEFTLTFKRPQVYLQLYNLSNFNPKDSNSEAIGLGGQKLKAWIGFQGDPVAQNINCNFSNPNKPVCDGVGLYSNGLSSTVMSYMTSLLDKDLLIKGTVDFTRSSGYNIVDFTIDSEN